MTELEAYKGMCARLDDSRVRMIEQVDEINRINRLHIEDAEMISRLRGVLVEIERTTVCDVARLLASAGLRG